MNNTFLIAALKKYGFSGNFIDCIKILLNNQESCVIIGGHTTKYCKLERGARQGDSISTYLFILAFEIFFIMIKRNKNTHGSKILILKDLQSFSSFPLLRPNFTKCKIARLGFLKSVNMALCGMKCLDLTKEYVKVLGVHMSSNRKLQGDKIFRDTVKNICNVKKFWGMRHL